MDRHSYILDISSSFPPYRYTQDQMRDAFIRNNPSSEEDISFIHRVFNGTQNEECRSFLSEDKLFSRMNREEYILYIRSSLISLAIEASESILSSMNRKDITHIIWGSMTGCIYAPCMSSTLKSLLGLSPYVKDTNIENMGCLTGYSVLSLAASIARDDPNNMILTIVGDIRSSLGNLFTPHSDNQPIDKSNVIVGALFRDSCGAAIISGKSYNDRTPLYEIINTQCYTIPDTFDSVKYTEKNDGYVHLNISKDLPMLVSNQIKEFTLRLIQDYTQINQCDICLHTGGPRVINGVRDALDVSNDQLEATWHIMKKYGNLSGSSNIVVLDHHTRIPNTKDWIICLSMGPGISMMGLLLKKYN